MEHMRNHTQNPWELLFDFYLHLWLSVHFMAPLSLDMRIVAC